MAYIQQLDIEKAFYLFTTFRGCANNMIPKLRIAAIWEVRYRRSARLVFNVRGRRLDNGGVSSIISF